VREVRIAPVSYPDDMIDMTAGTETYDASVSKVRLARFGTRLLPTSTVSTATTTSRALT